MELSAHMISALRALGRGEVIPGGPTRKALDRRGLIRFTGESRNAIELTAEGRKALAEIESQAYADAPPVDYRTEQEKAEADAPFTLDRETVIREAVAVTGESREIIESVMDALDAVAEDETIEAKDFTHEFMGDVGRYCLKHVERPDGKIEQCGEPTKSPIHDPQAYAAYHAEVSAALAEWSGAGQPSKVMLSPGVTEQDGQVVPDADLLQLLALLDHGVVITRNLYQNWRVERTAALALPLDPVKLDRTVRAALDVGLAHTEDGGPVRMYRLCAAPIHLARNDHETWCGRRILRASMGRIRYTTGSVEGPKHRRCVERSTNRRKQAGR